MDASGGRTRTQTLGDRLLSLGPGHACPCCGRPMKSLSAAPGCGLPGARGEGSATGSSMLVCSACGCEVDAQEQPYGAGTCRTFCVAA